MSIQSYLTQNSVDLFEQSGASIRLGQVDRVYFIDDEQNISKKYAEYDVHVFDDRGGQTLLRNVRAISELGGANDHSERIYEDSEYAFKGKLNQENSPQNKNGSLVIIIFLDGSMYKPYILGSIDHPQVEAQATKEKGIHRYTEFRGLRQEINKDGELEITFNGPANADGTPVVEDQKPITLKVGKTGGVAAEGGHQLVFESGETGDRFVLATAGSQLFLIEDTEGEEAISLIHKKGAIFNIDPKGSILLTGANGSYVSLNSDTDEVTLTHKEGHIIGMTSDEITISDKGGADILTISDGKVQLTSSGDVAMQASAIGGNAGTVEMKDQIGAALKITNGQVALGGPTAELLDLFDQLLTQMDTLLTTMSTSTHVGNLGFPTSPPVEAAAYAAVQVQVALIKTLLATIKGTL